MGKKSISWKITKDIWNNSFAEKDKNREGGIMNFSVKWQKIVEEKGK